MYSKLEITGKIEILTGLHIGGSKEFSAIGSVDSPVMRDSYSNKPFIPGTSLKGKLRYLLQECYGQKAKDINTSHKDDAPIVRRLFGASNDKSEEAPIRSRLYFSDAFLANEENLKDIGIDQVTEVKFENSIHRFTAVANPRQIERVVRGAEFDLSLIYNLEKENELEEDIYYVKEAFKLLTYDYLGASGSRGYGRVKIKNLHIRQVVGDLEETTVEKLDKMLGDS